MSILFRSFQCIAMTVVALIAVIPCAAQQVSNSGERVALEARAARADSVALLESDGQAARAERRAEAAAIRNRLREGDFHPGDRITLWVNGEAALSNTFTVRQGNVLAIPSLPEISLRGVLRSELRDVLFREIRQFIKEPEIQVSSSITVAVIGAVGRPGFFAVAPDAPLTDVLMTAGGPTANADLDRSRIARAGVDLATPAVFHSLLAANRTLDDIGLQSGDEIKITERTHRWQSTSAVLGTLVLLTSSSLFLFRKH